MILAHSIRLDPNNLQATYFSKAAGTARFAYNWALSEWQKQYDDWKENHHLPKPTQGALRRQLNTVKREQFPWMLEVTKNAPQMAIMQLGRAFDNFIAGRTRRPRFRRKGVHDRFTLTNDQFILDGLRIRIPNLGWVRMCEPLRFSGKILSATVSREADHWQVSIAVETDAPVLLPNAENQGVVGVDLGVSALATLSTGECIIGPKAHTAQLARLRRLSRSLSLKQKGSRNRAKARRKLARLHARIGNIRRDAMHKLTTDLTRRFRVIGIEDLNVGGMMKNRHLSRAIADMGFHEFKRQMTYKAAVRGGTVVVAGRWFPSSKTCSNCGSVMKDMALSIRQWTCPACGAQHDRDVNAAINLRNMAVSSTVSACGEEGTGFGCRIGVKPSLMNQEVSTEPIYIKINRFR